MEALTGGWFSIRFTEALVFDESGIRIDRENLKPCYQLDFDIDTLESLLAMNKDLCRRDKLDIGIISDTHGSLSRKAREVLGRTDIIVHAGDFDTPEVLAALEKMAPVVAVRGNMDYGGWASRLPVTELVEIGGIYLYMLHNLNALDLDPSAADIGVVVSGHTHQAAAVPADGVLFLNPGSATSPRYNSDASVAILQVDNGALRYQFFEVA